MRDGMKILPCGNEISQGKNERWNENPAIWE
jgi:hypothetical protein